MRYGEKLRKVNIRRSRGREFVVEVPKIKEPDYDHKVHEEAAANAAGIEHVSEKYKHKEFIDRIKNSNKIVAKTKEDAIAGAHILSALHLLYRAYGAIRGNYPEDIAENIGYKVDKEDEKLFKKAVGLVEWLSGKYPKAGHIILYSPDEIEKNINDIVTKIALDLNVTDAEEKELIKKYLLAATRIAKTIASAISKENPTRTIDTYDITKKALQLERDSLLELYNIRRRIGEKKRGEDPHESYPEIIEEPIRQIKERELKERRKLEEERRRREEEERRRKEELRQRELETEKKNALEMLEKLVTAESDSEREGLVKQIKNIIKHPETWEELAKVKPEWVKDYVEEQIKSGKDPREFVEEEKLAIEKEFMEEFLKQHGFLKEVEEKAEEIKERVEKIEKAMEQAKVEGASDVSSGVGVFKDALVEVLSILNGLEFAGYSEEAKQKAIEKLSARIAELSEEELTPENLQKLGLYAFAIEMIKRGNFERLREIEKL